MSQENVQVVRRLLDAFNRQDAATAADLWAVAGEWRPAFIGGGLLEGAVFRGPDGATEFVERQSETWDRVVAEPMAIRDLGDHVLVEVHLQAVGRVEIVEQMIEASRPIASTSDRPRPRRELTCPGLSTPPAPRRRGPGCG